MTFSIITVAYNAEAVLGRTIDSVFQQTYPDIEYIIIDGNSNDETLSLIKRKESESGDKSGFTFKWISEPDNGIYDAMNKGLSIATGDYICFLNAGDSLKKSSILSDLASVLKLRNMPDIIYGETDLVDSENKVISSRRLKTPQNLTWKSFRMGMLVCHQAFILKRSIAPEYDLQYRYSSDFDWCIRCMKKAWTIVNSEIILINYQYEGTTTANRSSSLKERYKIMCKYYGIIPTQIRHLWFAVRFYYAKIFSNNC